MVAKVVRMEAFAGRIPVPGPTDFDQVFDEHLDRVWRALHAMGVPAHQVEDAAQEVFLIVHDKLATFEGRSKLSTWIYAIAHRVGANYRSKARRQPRLCSLDESQAAAAGGTPEQQLSHKESTDFIERFCCGLEDGMRDVFVLCLVEQQQPPDVAAVLGMSPNTVYSRVRLLRAALRSALERHHGQGDES